MFVEGSSDKTALEKIFQKIYKNIPEDAIVEGETSKFVYSTTNIKCKNIEKVKKRNDKKKEIMDFSLNLDHALYDIQNLDDNQKQLYADRFYEMFDGQKDMFIEFLKTDVANGVPDTYLQSWRYIRKELHSLERHTNLHLYFDLHPVL